MPRRSSQYKHVKVYRPDGMKYAEGRSLVSPLATPTPNSLGMSAYPALSQALRNFNREFGHLPGAHEGTAVFEMTYVNGVIEATVMEVPD